MAQLDGARQRRKRARAVMSKKSGGRGKRLENGGLECASAAPQVVSAQRKGLGSVAVIVVGQKTGGMAADG